MEADGGDKGSMWPMVHVVHYGWKVLGTGAGYIVSAVGKQRMRGVRDQVASFFFLWGLGPKPWELDCHIQVRFHVSYLIKIITHRYDWRPAYQIIFLWDSWRLDSQLGQVDNQQEPSHSSRPIFIQRQKEKQNKPQMHTKISFLCWVQCPASFLYLIYQFKNQGFQFFSVHTVPLLQPGKSVCYISHCF